MTAEEGLHVAVNAHLLSGRDSYRSAGVHQYIRHLLRHLGGVESGMRFTALLGAEAVEPATDLPVLRSRVDTSKPASRVLWEQLRQPRVLREIKADLIHGPVFVGPLVAPCPIVTTIHDLSFIRFPRLFRPVNRLYLTTMTRLSARRARRLIAVSEYTARESVELLSIPREKIKVVYHGVNGAFRPLPDEEVTSFRTRRDLPEQFVVFVGTLEPRKNLVRLIEAFAEVQDGRHKLVLAGGKGWLCEELFARVEDLGLENDVQFPGYVPNEELPLWYNAAMALVYPSLYEGFGMPVTEAQACGTPVLASNTSSLPEAAGDAALLVDPHDAEAIAAGLRQILSDSALREQLSRRGLEHAQTFSWPRTARETVQVYGNAAA
ncbi:MAG: glycosyltransferase family 1 protein [Anaerolineae bacterium]